MRDFSIQEMERLCETKAATLRIWEKRYNLLKPGRNSGNNRLYTIEDLRDLLHIMLLKNNGWKISVLAQFDYETLAEKAGKLMHIADRQKLAFNRLLIQMFSTDVEAFENEINSLFATFGTDTSLKNIIVPFLEKVDLLDYTSGRNEIHIAVTVIRKKIIYCIESLVPAKRREESALLFLPKDEHYDLMLLYMCYLLKKAGYRVLYLGTNIPEENIIQMLKKEKLAEVYTYVTRGSNSRVSSLIASIARERPEQKINLVGGEGTLGLQQSSESVKFIHYQNLTEMVQIA